MRGDGKGGKPGAKRTVRLDGPDRCGLVSVLRSRSFARHGGAGGSWALAWARPFTRARVPGAAVTAWRGATDQRQFAGPFDAGRGWFVVRAWCPYARAWIARGVPRDIVTRINAEVAKAVNSPDIKARFEALGIEPVGNSPDAAARFLDDEIAKWAKVIGVAGVKAE